MTVINRLSFSRTDVQFVVYHNDKLVLSLVENSLPSRMSTLFGIDSTKKMILVDKGDESIKIHGWVGDYSQHRGSQQYQYFYINNRFVQSVLLSRALRDGYGDMAQGKYPVGVLFIEMNGAEFDINISPTKKEVRFLNESLVRDKIISFVSKSISETLNLPKIEISKLNHAPVASQNTPFVQSNMTLKDEEKPLPSSEVFIATNERDDDKQNVLHEKKEEIKAENNEVYSFSVEEKTVVEEVSEDKKLIDEREVIKSVPYFQFNREFILFEMTECLAVVNQKRAHERILYEEVLNKLHSNGSLSSQQLLFPEIIEFNKIEITLLDDYIEYIRNLGFDLQHFGGESFQLRSIPADVNQKEGISVILQIVRNLENCKDKGDIFIHLAKSYAKYISISLDNFLTQEDMRLLIDELFSTQNPYVSPFGKPVVWKYPIEEFHKKFQIQHKELNL